MPTYKYQNTAGKTMWYCSFYYTDWKGERKRKVKRGFTTRRDASRYEDARGHISGRFRALGGEIYH